MERISVYLNMDEAVDVTNYPCHLIHAVELHKYDAESFRCIIEVLDLIPRLLVNFTTYNLILQFRRKCHRFKDTIPVAM